MRLFKKNQMFRIYSALWSYTGLEYNSSRLKVAPKMNTKHSYAQGLTE